MDLAVRALQVLRRVEVAAVADRVVEELVLVEEEARAEVRVVRPVEILRGQEERLLLGEGAVLDAATDDARRRRALGGAAGLAERNVEPAGARVVRVERDVHQAAVLPHPDRRQPGDGRLGDAVAEDAQPPRTLGHEQRAVRQDLDVPRIGEAIDDGLDAEGVLLGRHGAGRQRRRPGPRERAAGGAIAQLADVDHHRADVLLVERGAEPQHRRAGPAVLDAGSNLGVTAAVGPRVVEQARRRAAAAVGAVTAGAHLSEGGDDAARRLRGLREEERRGHCRAEEGGGERRTGEPSGHAEHCMCVDGACTRRQPHDASGLRPRHSCGGRVGHAGGMKVGGRALTRGRGPCLRRSSRRGACRARDTAAPGACWPRRRRRSRP